jgi:6-phosphogluconolactonase
MLDGILVRLDSPDAVAAHAADLVTQACEQAIKDRGRFTLALAGGSTPKLLYRLLATRKPALDWSRCVLLFGDERCVPHDHPDSNMKMAETTLTGPAGVPHSSILPVPTHLPPAQAAATYEATLRRLLPEQGPGIDVVLLGMGADGHTLSLFPGDDAAVAESNRWCIHTKAPAPFAVPDRVTMTLPLVNAARLRLFMVTGADKSPRLDAIVAGTQTPPAAMVRQATWLVAT